MPKENLSSDKIKTLASKKFPMKLSIFEIAFIREIRKHKFGRIIAVITDGIPLRIEKNVSEMITDTDSYKETINNLPKPNETKN